MISDCVKVAMYAGYAVRTGAVLNGVVLNGAALNGAVQRHDLFLQ